MDTYALEHTHAGLPKNKKRKEEDNDNGRDAASANALWFFEFHVFE